MLTNITLQEVKEALASEHYTGCKWTELTDHQKATLTDKVAENYTKTQAIPYDSTVDTLKHIKRVSQLLTEAAAELIFRANKHDDSKLKFPEKEVFDEFTPKLAGSTYGSDEYKAFLKEMKVALDHHYANNSHHPEHYTFGVSDMDLFDLVEMFFDWKAATERHEDGDLIKSLVVNSKRFELSPQLYNIFVNTVNRYGRRKGWKEANHSIE